MYLYRFLQAFDSICTSIATSDELRTPWEHICNPLPQYVLRIALRRQRMRTCLFVDCAFSSMSVCNPAITYYHYIVCKWGK